MIRVAISGLGQMGRTVADVRKMFRCVALPVPAPAARKQQLKVGAFCRIGAAPAEPEIETAWRQSLTLLADLGHSVEEIAAPYDPDECSAIVMKLGAVGVARAIAHLPDWQARATPQIAALAAEGLKTVAVDSHVMPLGNVTKMTDAERKLLGAWIDQGAKAP